MHFVLLATHSAEVCPTSNGRTRELLLSVGPQIPGMAESAGVTIVAGPYVNREHITVVVLEAETADAVDRFVVDSRLNQWNSIRVLPSLSIEQALARLEEQPALF